MKTGPGGHKHIDSRGKLTTYDRQSSTGPDKPHEHTLDFNTLSDADIEVIRQQLGLGVPPPAEPPPVEPPPVEPPPGTPTTVGSPASLMDALSDNSVTAIKGDGTWQVSGATAQKADSLWIGSRFAGRTNPVKVDLAGVTLDGRGAGYFVGLAFEEGVHDQQWLGFPKIGNGNPTSTGAVIFGGFSGPEPHNISLEVELLNTLWATSGPGVSHDHGVYFSSYAGSGHRLNVKADLLTQAAGKEPLDSIIHCYHTPGVRNTVVRVQGRGTPQAVIVWESTVSLTLEDSLIDGAEIGVRLEAGSLILRRARTANSKVKGYYSATGKAPLYDGCRFDGQEVVLL